MPEGYLHLTYEQRCQIYALLQSAHSQADIARHLGVTRSTVSRELARNAGARGYRFKQAHAAASRRRQQASNRPRKMTPYVVALIERIMKQQQWSPEQIAGRLAREGIVSISHETIYRHVWEDKKDGGNLHLHLRHNGKKYHKRQSRNSGRGLIPGRVDIDQRPAIVAAKSRIGDWEADTIIGAKHKGAVMSHVERKSKYTKLAKLPAKTANAVVTASRRLLLPLAHRIETITYDNGKEFAAHAAIANSLGALCFFAERARIFDPAAAMQLSQRRRAEAVDIMDRMERTLEDGRATMTPPAYGVVDTASTVFLGRMEFVGLGAEIPKRPALLRYWRAMQARPSFTGADIWTRFTSSV